METIGFIIVIILLLIIILLLALRNRRPEAVNNDPLVYRIDQAIRSESAQTRDETQRNLRTGREELQHLTKLTDEKLERQLLSNEARLSTALKAFQESFTNSVREFNDLQRQKFSDIQNRNDQFKTDMDLKFERIRETVEKKLYAIQEENGKKLEEMRQTVDEKLHATVEKRFSESFRMISDRLEQVHKGLGEMQSLATGVGDLKKVLTNVKSRGNLGEIQLGSILQEIFANEQYEQNAITRPGSSERVEFVIKLPGKNEDNSPVLLPIDSKFPNEDYQRLIEAYELMTTDGKAIEAVSRQFETAVKRCAKDICEKYINPPVTTDFAIMFVPTEGLYAEILRKTGLFEALRREYKVTVVGPTNLVAFLNSLQMGFRTLAIERRSSEVWEVLGAVKTEFTRFGDVLEKTKKKLKEATDTIDKASVRTRAIGRQLRKVEELPHEQAQALLGEGLAFDQEDEAANEERTEERS